MCPVEPPTKPRRVSRPLVTTTFLLLTALSRAAFAEETAPTPPTDKQQIAEEPAPAPQRVWYGWQTLAVDGAALGTMGVAFAVKDQNAAAGLAYMSLGTYALGPPAVNIAHGNGFGALRSLGVRVLAPPAGALVVGAFGGAAGFAVGLSCQCEGGPLIGFGFGWVFGLLGGGLAGYGAAVISDAMLAYERPLRREAPTPAQSRWTVAPKVALSPKGGVQVGLGGAF
jgi:hypothetical protein